MTFLASLFDERHEIAAWLTMTMAIAGNLSGRLGDWPAVALVCVALVVFGVLDSASVGPQGAEIDGGQE